MDAETRKTLEALANDANDLCTTTMDERAAIRAALAEVDALRSQVADLTATLDGAVDLRKSIEREREEARYQVDALTQQVASHAESLASAWADRDEARRNAAAADLRCQSAWDERRETRDENARLRAQVADLSGALVTIEERLRLDAAPLVELANADGTSRMRHAWKAVYSSAVHAQCFIVPALSAAKDS